MFAQALKATENQRIWSKENILKVSVFEHSNQVLQKVTRLNSDTRFSLGKQDKVNIKKTQVKLSFATLAATED